MSMSIQPMVALIAIPLVSAPLVYLIGRVSLIRHGIGSLARWAGLAVLVITWVPFVLAYQSLQMSGPSSATFGSIHLRMDGLSLLLAGIALALSTLVALFSGPYLAREDGEEKYYALLCALAGTMIGLGCANDLFNLWVWFEAMAISSYLLVAFYHTQQDALEAGVKYLIQSAVGSVLVLLGIAIVFANTGTLSLDYIRAGGSSSPMLMAAGALFLIGFGVKTALVPMHTWLPDAHSQAPSGISAMLSGVVIEAGLVALLRSLGALSRVTPAWGVLLLAFGTLNMLFGNLMALRQTQVKRLLAYSSLAHVGYMLLGIGIAVTFHLVDGAQGGLFHLLNHGIMKGLAFLAAGAFLYALYISRGDHSPLLVSDLAGAARRYPLAAFALSVAVLGLGGLPPLAGFMSKWQIFVAGFATKNVWIYALVIFAALNSLLSLGYYAPLVNQMYRHQPSAAVESGKAIPLAINIPLLVLALAVVILGLWPSLVSGLTAPAGSALLAAFGG
jgi:proton-translocating NADH-quinone oxidoreductase chain N